MHVSGQTEQSEAKQSCFADPTFAELVHEEVGKAVREAVGKTVGKA